MFNFGNRAGIGRGGNSLVGSPERRRGSALFPPHLYPPPGSVPIFASAAVSSVAAGIVAPAGLQFILPRGRVGVLRVLTPFIDAPTSATIVTWQVRVNGSAPNGLPALTVIGRDAASIEKVFDQWSLELPEAAQIDVQINNQDGGQYTLGMQLEGWHWSAETTETEDPRITAALAAAATAGGA